MLHFVQHDELRFCVAWRKVEGEGTLDERITPSLTLPLRWGENTDLFV